MLFSITFAVLIVAGIVVAVGYSDFASYRYEERPARTEHVGPSDSSGVRINTAQPDESPNTASGNDSDAEIGAVTPTPTPGLTEKIENITAAGKPAISDEVFDGRRISLTDEEWRLRLTPEQFYILRQKGTEKPFSGEYHDSKAAGAYHCAACGLKLFISGTKFDSGTGWPSFYQPVNKRNVTEAVDKSMPQEVRTEVLCSRCGGHLGHVFDDGPEPTGLRYCINSLALDFRKR